MAQDEYGIPLKRLGKVVYYAITASGSDNSLFTTTYPPLSLFDDTRYTSFNAAISCLMNNSKEKYLLIRWYVTQARYVRIARSVLPAMQ